MGRKRFYHLSTDYPDETRPFYSLHHASYGVSAEGLCWMVRACQPQVASRIIEERASERCPRDRNIMMGLSQLTRLHPLKDCPHDPPCEMADALTELGVCVRLPGLACASTAKEAIALARE